MSSTTRTQSLSSSGSSTTSTSSRFSTMKAAFKSSMRLPSGIDSSPASSKSKDQSKQDFTPTVFGLGSQFRVGGH
ncbi:unnamed protein product [Zymoseptoria tritici ST99CH_3D7]|uniref:Uncharacterized protein n=1 Tax=Zymoseptoria tritici (strain ST99CH_3D7) TaxID=1276538 RepID=A0A1X7RMF8_ZYMT9|nr:unnamed protein product [Zymoseptoria tritici ST99CH_3D7]